MTNRILFSSGSELTKDSHLNDTNSTMHCWKVNFRQLKTPPRLCTSTVKAATLANSRCCNGLYALRNSFTCQITYNLLLGLKQKSPKKDYGVLAQKVKFYFPVYDLFSDTCCDWCTVILECFWRSLVIALASRSLYLLMLKNVTWMVMITSPPSSPTFRTYFTGVQHNACHKHWTWSKFHPHRRH